MTVAQILDLAGKIEKDELKIDDLVDGLMDFNEELAAIDESDDEDAEEDEADAGAHRQREPRAAEGRRDGEIRWRSASTSRACWSCCTKEGHKAPKYLELPEEDLRRS